MSKKLTYGVGYNSEGKHKTRENGRLTASHKQWKYMFDRCYSLKRQERCITYIDCIVAEEWHDFQNFADWFENHPYSRHGYNLDKDILIPNNKVYSPETCCFVPYNLNLMLTNRKNDRGKHPQGVDFHKPSGKYRAGIRINGKKKHLGSFECPNEAHQVYVEAKELHVKERALEWRDRIAEDVFNALMRWTVSP